jgi:hypothetical protein
MGRDDASDLLPGTLDLLILKTLAAGAAHGYGIAQRLRNQSFDTVSNPLPRRDHPPAGPVGEVEDR